MQTVADIFSLWPSDAELARDISLPYPTISAWKQRRSIPPAYWREIIRAAKRRGHSDVTADLLVDLHARKPTAALPNGFAEESSPMRHPVSPLPLGPQRLAASGAGRHNASTPPEELGHFTRFKHLRRDQFRTLDEINDHIAALREEWDRR